ncbi:hypothetical protein [Streptomyces zaomyceticus]|uniref:hypothetical protein n=1 Tax=Streptomyces zaomyceticus TaxID=68286 RepID=UPI002E142A9C|nr:hypothetical protein OG237_06310 [Streptomyces zaomyceticus]
MTAAVKSLHDVTHVALEPLPFDTALQAARDSLTEHSTADIHDHDEMITAAVALFIRLHGLVDALDAKDGQQ